MIKLLVVKKQIKMYNEGFMVAQKDTETSKY